MARRDVDGLDAPLGPEGVADRVPALRVDERGAAAALLAQFFVPADED
jgi:hypothetical protein